MFSMLLIYCWGKYHLKCYALTTLVLLSCAFMIFFVPQDARKLVVTPKEVASRVVRQEFKVVVKYQGTINLIVLLRMKKTLFSLRAQIRHGEGKTTTVH